MNNALFDKETIDKLTGSKPEYFIGIDDIDKKNMAYCLVAKVDGKTTVLLAKVMRNKKEFNEEYNNLAKYFNAKIMISK